jgi:hypothetical protein
MTRSRLLSAWTAVGLCACTGSERPPAAQPLVEKILLRYHPAAGATFRYVLDQTSRFAPDTSPADSGAPNTMHLAFTQTIGAAAADGISVTTTLDSGRVVSPMLSPASAEDAARRLRGLRLSDVYDDRLRVVRHDASALRRLPGTVADQVQLAFRATALPLPERPVGQGDRWTNEVDLPFSQLAGGAPLTATTTVTVRDIVVTAGDTTVRLGVVTGAPHRPLRFSFGGRPITVALSGLINGEILLSLTRGALVSAELGGTLGVRVTGGYFGPQGMAIRVDQQGTVHLVPP